MRSKFVKFLVVLAVVAIVANTIWSLISSYLEKSAARRAVAQAELADDPIGGIAGMGDGVMGKFSDCIPVGDPWQWRRLDTLSLRSELNFWSGDIDGDGSDELLTFNETTPLTIYRPDGRSQTTEYTNYDGYWQSFCCWDCDHDGREEIVARCSSIVHNIHGQKKLKLENYPYAWNILTRDTDDDGYDELISVEGPDEYWRTVFWGWDGKVIWDSGTVVGFGKTIGDFDGDGRMEAIRRREEHSGPPDYIKTVDQLELVDMDGNVTVFEDWPLETEVLACYDLDGDGVDELINGGYGYLNMVTGEFTAFEIPDGITIPERLRGGGTLVADLDGDGEPEIIHYCAPADLLVFKPSGECVYFEKFFLTLDVEVLYTPEQIYVVALTNNEILIYP